MDRYFEDAEIGDSCTTQSVSITSELIMAYAHVSGDFTPIHIDAEYARTTLYGQRIAHGLLGLSITDGLKQQSTYRFHPGLSVNWTWNMLKPILVGDEVRVHFRIAAKRLSNSRPGWGIITVPTELHNQDFETVARGEHVIMVLCRPAAG